MSPFTHPAVVIAAWATSGAALAYLSIGLVVDLRRRGERWLQSRCLDQLTSIAFGSDDQAAEAARRLGRFPDTVVARAAQQLTIDFEGEVTERLQDLLSTMGFTSRIHSLIRARSWRRRCQGASLSSLLSADDPLRTRLVEDPHRQVRAVAIGSLDGPGATRCAEVLLDLLSTHDEGVRLEAQQALLRADASIVATLVDHLRHAEGPAATLVLEIATKISDPRLHEAAASHATSDDPARRAMAARVQIPGSAETAVLQRFLRDPDPMVRAAGAAAVGTARAELLASDVGRMLGDTDWAVRYEAGATLASMGPLGRLVLRSHLSDPDPFARDMARRCIDQLCARGDDAVRPARVLHDVGPWSEGSAA